MQAARALLGEPYRAAALIFLGDRDLDEAGSLQRPQISRQRRLIEAGALGERSKRIVWRGGDLRHQPKLGDAKPASLHALFEEVGDAPCREPACPAGARVPPRRGRR